MKENQKIIQFEDAKNPKKKIDKKKWILRGSLGFILLLVVLGLVFRTTKIKITGNTYYTEQECRVAIKKNGLTANTLLFYLQNKFVPRKSLPFVKGLDVSLGKPGHMTISVKEKARAGCVSYNGKYIYFDRSGNALESSTKRYVDVPLVTGLSYKKVVLNEKLPEKNQKIFDKILRVTIAVDKYKLGINQIHFDEKKHMYLMKNELTIDLWTEDDLEGKLSELSGAIQSLSGKKGTVSFEYYTKDDPMMIFKAKK